MNKVQKILTLLGSLVLAQGVAQAEQLEQSQERSFETRVQDLQNLHGQSSEQAPFADLYGAEGWGNAWANQSGGGWANTSCGGSWGNAWSNAGGWANSWSNCS